jgi:aldose 1-epimerase
MTNRRDFGTTGDGRPVQAVTIGAGDLRATILTLGSIVQDVRLAGHAHSLTPGSDRLADYEGQMRYHGPLVGPVANRIAGASAEIAGRLHRFDANEAAGHCLHGGATGTQAQVWQIAEVTADSVTLTLDLPDGLGGFPGNRRIRARWQVRAPATLHLRLSAGTDAPTLMNIANHSYWNLDGTPDWSGHRLRIAADQYLPTDAAMIPTGAVAAVAGSAMDFRQGRVITPGGPLLDTCFCLSDRRRPLREVLWLTGASGLCLTVATTEPGIQVYDGRNAQRPGHATYEGLAIEPQFWPDAPHQPGFPAIDLVPGKDWQQITEWRFARG